MALIVGLDIASTAGIAFYDTDRAEAAIIARTIKVKGDSSEEKAWRAPQAFYRLIEAQGKPNFVCIEEALKHAPSGKSIHPVIQANVLAGSYVGVLGLFGCPAETVTPAVWRKAMFGDGRRKGWSSPDWKRAAKQQCQQMGVDVKNADEAEAVLIAIYGARCSAWAQRQKYEAQKRSAA